MKRRTTALVLLICGLVLSASLADLHCTALRPSSATVVLACSANRLEAQP
jgi:hypothetical protein